MLSRIEKLVIQKLCLIIASSKIHLPRNYAIIGHKTHINIAYKALEDMRILTCRKQCLKT